MLRYMRTRTAFSVIILVGIMLGVVGLLVFISNIAVPQASPL
jgi:hypothetical protein